jgi:hypothetical protein
MGVYLDDANSWREFVGEFGEPEEVSREDLMGFAPNLVWTLRSSRSSEFLVNETGDGDEVLSYWVTPRPWTQPQGTSFVTMTLWVDCPKCYEESEKDEDWDQDDCEECEGGGTLAIFMPDCVNAKTEEEVWAARQA